MHIYLLVLVLKDFFRPTQVYSFLICLGIKDNE